MSLSMHLKKTSPPAILAFMGILLLLNIPNLFFIESNNSQILNNIEYIERLFISIFLGSIIIVLFNRPARAFILIWLFALWWLPLAFGVRIINSTPVNPTLIGMAVATSPSELHNLLSTLSIGWLFFFIAWNAICTIIYIWIRSKNNWHWEIPFRGKILFLSITMLILAYALTSNSSVKTPSNTKNRNTHSPSFPSSKYDPDHPLYKFAEVDQPFGRWENMGKIFPYELPLAITQYVQARGVIDAIRAMLLPPSNASSLSVSEAEAEIVVLIIGESSTRNAWHWFNPQAPATTPLLEMRVARGEALFGFGETLAQTTSTRQAVPSMLTAQPLVWPDGTPNPQATYSIVWAAKQAGYATAWFSNQAAVGRHDGIIASYAHEANSTAFLNPATFSQQGSVDTVLLPALRSHLSKNKKSFIVLHTMGSHFNYRHRYPEGFGIYAKKPSAREAYLNSILYTDFFLDQIMSILEFDGRRAALIYASDHGETIPEGACGKSAANRTTRDAYEVPALVWLSQSYVQSFHLLAEQLYAQQKNHYTIAAVHSTVLDLMRGDINTPLEHQELQSFARTSRHMEIMGSEKISSWQKKFNSAAKKNPCLMILK